jgi:hypothetical protein
MHLDVRAFGPDRGLLACFIPLLDKVKLEIRELELFKEFRLVELQPRILRAHLKFKKRGLRKSRSASARSQRIHMAGILPLKLILAENTEDAYLIITSRFNSFRTSLVLSTSSAAFPTMT